MVVGLSEILRLNSKTSYTRYAHYYHNVGLKKYELNLQLMKKEQISKKNKSRISPKLVEYFNLSMKNGKKGIVSCIS
jgi:hypothetical protein